MTNCQICHEKCNSGNVLPSIRLERFSDCQQEYFFKKINFTAKDTKKIPIDFRLCLNHFDGKLIIGKDSIKQYPDLIIECFNSTNLDNSDDDSDQISINYKKHLEMENKLDENSK